MGKEAVGNLNWGTQVIIYCNTEWKPSSYVDSQSFLICKTGFITLPSVALEFKCMVMNIQTTTATTNKKILRFAFDFLQPRFSPTWVAAAI